ncbi:protein JINGUBANG [Oryza sativa Japonica Group]|jgi:WD40 repeat protein|uniref:Os03g0738700 protein n=6 Tax=Oryza TaxID=4527 RepID=Q10D64_ORYSJ|nr:protein JINGUBANG [Oryza sativa Japonica Group]EEC76151.1 hypothetical protein OsI_13442 [Oryza sativa Indica Group]KAB8093493.1 hypothetical protein EE612_020334 [Oryza sativa]ABF98776.1 transducin family protein, putative, expressed [Oryza sativa Japonica Group]KAF2941223.1 hypothetical protein DAI22_03g331800 [Oryza sativa Japonica Group]BAF13127.1 Os03g0738700 [Oryza sativa Japonica Group]|eukprot:NP_001051213.1 Os03g0738700 [Oryza sativa Japonica Group]
MRDSDGEGAGGGLPRSHPSNLPLPAPHSDPNLQFSGTDDDFSNRHSSSSATGGASPGYYSDYPSSFSGECSPYNMSPWNQTMASPWSHHSDASMAGLGGAPAMAPGTSLIGSLVREEGHIYSLAAKTDTLYTGSDSKNIRVWRKQKDSGGFKSSSGLVKAIVISGERIFTGHQDGKIRVWKVSPKNGLHKRVGSLPRLRDFLRGSLNPSNYVEVRKNRTALWIRHSDAVSCLSPTDSAQGLLYSGSWDRTFKVWRINDSKCLESVVAHDDNVNAIVAAFDGLVFTGSADGTVKVWKRELQGKGTKHVAVQTLLKQEHAVNALAVSAVAPVLYCGSSDGLVNFWEGERHLVHGGVLRGHKKAVFCLAAAGSLLLSGSADNTIYVWRRDGGVHSCLSVLTGHTEPIRCLAIVEDNKDNAAVPVDAVDSSFASGSSTRWIVYSGSLDKSIKVWRVAEDAPDALLRGPGGGDAPQMFDRYPGDPFGASSSSFR